MLSHALYSLAYEFRVRGRYAANHVLHIGVIQHRAVYDVAFRRMIECVSGYFPAVYHNVVPSACDGIHAEFVEHEHNKVDVFVESEVHVTFVRYI